MKITLPNGKTLTDLMILDILTGIPNEDYMQYYNIEDILYVTAGALMMSKSVSSGTSIRLVKLIDELQNMLPKNKTLEDYMPISYYALLENYDYYANNYKIYLGIELKSTYYILRFCQHSSSIYLSHHVVYDKYCIFYGKDTINTLLENNKLLNLTENNKLIERMIKDVISNK